MRWLILNQVGNRLGDFAVAQDLTQSVYAGCSQVEVDDSDPRLVAPIVPVPPTPRQWLERLSPATQLALETAALSNAQVALWLRKATGAGLIDVTLQETKDGVAAMVSAGLLSAADQTLLLTP